MNFEMNDYNFHVAIKRLIKLIRRNFKFKVALAIKIVSNESGFSQKELAYELYRLKVLKIDENRITHICQNI
jgi:hypothetical protein